MENIDDKPAKHLFTKYLMHCPLGEKTFILMMFWGNLLTKYLLQKYLDENANDPDHIKNCGLCSMFLTILILQQQNMMVKETSEEMFLTIAQIESMLTPQLSETFKCRFIVNWRGVGNNTGFLRLREIRENLENSGKN